MGLDFAAIWTAPYSTWLLEGVRVTLRLTGIGIVGSTILALVLVLMRMSGQKIASKISGGVRSLFPKHPVPCADTLLVLRISRNTSAVAAGKVVCRRF